MSQLISKVVNLGEKLVFTHQKGQVLQLSQDDNKVIQQIRSSHSPDANIVVDEKSILNISQNILNRASPSPLLDSKADSAVPDDKASGMSDALAFTIHKIGCELSCNCTGEGDLKAITLSVFNLLTKYAWDAKVVLALAAFTASYGEFCLLSQLHASNTLAKYVYILKPLPDISEQESLITELLKVVAEVSSCIIELIDLPTQYISQDKPPLSDALNLVPTSVYLAIKGIVACSVQSIGLVNVGHQYTVSITETRKKLTELTQTLKSCYVQLTNHLDLCHKHIDDKRRNQGYHIIEDIMQTTTHKDITGIATAFIQTKEDLPLFNGVNKKRVSLDVLKGKAVMFFFSYLDISDEEIQEIIQQVGKQERQYEIVWIPIIGVPAISNEIRQEILRKASLMLWYSLHYSVALRPGAIKFIKEKWHFDKKPLLVVFNAQGNIINQNAYHMLMTWGSQAFPFDAEREKSLWKGTTWSLQFLVDEHDRAQLLKEGKVVCFYEGEDIDWIRKFTAGIKEVVKGEGVILELIYVGKKHKETIMKENLSKCWDAMKIKRFHDRVESIMYSKLQHDLMIKTDAVLKDVMLLLGAEGSVLIAYGSKPLFTMNARVSMDWLAQIKKAKMSITVATVFDVISAVFHEVVGPSIGSGDPSDPAAGPAAVPKHCNHIVVPNNNGINQESMVCVDCNRPMEKFVMFKCCVED